MYFHDVKRIDLLLFTSHLYFLFSRDTKFHVIEYLDGLVKPIMYGEKLDTLKNELELKQNWKMKNDCWLDHTK